MRKPDRSGAGGHIGCSEGFNYNIYKPFLPYKQPNSQVRIAVINISSQKIQMLQGREQTHSKLEPLCRSLKQMDYTDFMNFLRVWFGLTNLMNMKQI